MMNILEYVLVSIVSDADTLMALASVNLSLAGVRKGASN